TFLPRPRRLHKPRGLPGSPNLTPQIPSTVDMQCLPGDVAASRTTNKQSRFGNLPRTAGATHGVRLRIARSDVLAIGSPTFRDDCTGRYAVHPDSQGRPLDGDGLTERDDPSACRARVRDLVQAPRRDDYRHNTSRQGRVAPAPRCPLHHIECTRQVGLDDRPPTLFTEVEGCLRKLAAGAADEQIDFAMTTPNRIEQGVHARALTDIECGTFAMKALPDNRLAGSRQLLGIAAADDDRGIQARGEPGGGSPDATAASGDHDDASRQQVLRQRRGQRGQLRVTERKGLLRRHVPNSSPLMMSLRTSVVPAPISSSL